MKRVWHSSDLRLHGIMVGTVLLGVLVTATAWFFLEPAPIALLFLAVMVSEWYGGLGPGLLATLLAMVASARVFFSPLSVLFSPTSEALPCLGVFMLLALLMSERPQRCSLPPGGDLAEGARCLAGDLR